MDLLLLTVDPHPESVLPALALLAHHVRSAPTEVSSLLEAGTADVAIVDARTDLAAARGLCRLLGTTGTSVPVVAVVNEGGLVAVNVDWGLDEILLPSTGPAEIDARLRLLVGRRGGAADQENLGKVSLGELVIDEGTYTARLRGRPLDLTYKEFELLKYLAQHAGRVFTRAQLLQEVWGYDFFGGTRTVDVHVRRLRAKLGPEYESLIGTVRNVGYKAVRPARGRTPAAGADVPDELDDDPYADAPDGLSESDRPPSQSVTAFGWRSTLTEAEQQAIRELVAVATGQDGVAPVGDQVLRELPYDRTRHLVAEDVGAVVGYLNLVPATPESSAMAEAVVHPTARRRGIGAGLIRAGLAEGGTGTRIWAHGDLEAARATANELDLVAARELWQMRRNLTDLPAVTQVRGAELRTYSGPGDDDELLRVNNAAFAWHPEQAGWTERDVAERRGESWFDPAGLFLATDVDSGALLGFHWTKIHGNGLGGRSAATRGMDSARCTSSASIRPRRGAGSAAC